MIRSAWLDHRCARDGVRLFSFHKSTFESSMRTCIDIKIRCKYVNQTKERYFHMVESGKAVSNDGKMAQALLDRRA